MNIAIKTYLLNGFDKDQTKIIVKVLNFISNKKKVDNQISVIDKLNIKLEPNDFLIIFLDELTLSNLIHESNSQQFFVKKEFLNNQVIIVLDDLKISDIPEYLHLLPVFSLKTFNKHSYSEEEDWDAKGTNTSQLIEILNDIVLFIIRSKYPQLSEKITVYIGPYDDSTTIEFQKITRELLNRQFNVVPEILNPTGKELIDNQEYLLEMLQKSDFAIHFIGHQSIIDFPEKKSPVIIINQITADYCSTPEGENLQRIIYVPAESSDISELMEHKISLFKSNSQNLINAELIQTPIEKLKEIALQKINELSKPLTHSILDEEMEKDIYFIYPAENENEIAPYIKYLDVEKISYSLSHGGLDQLELLRYHQKQLVSCKGVFIYNAGNELWLERKLSDIIKSPGWGRKMPFRFIGVFGKEISSDQTKKINYRGITFLKDEKALKDFKLKELLFNN